MILKCQNALLKASRYADLTREEKIIWLKALVARLNPLCFICANCRTIE
jgi:hypothetical protein